MSTANIHMSRAFVEFGPFTLEEFHTFKNRGILRDTDYFRKEGESHWMHVAEFALSHPLEAPSKTKTNKSSSTSKTSTTKPANTSSKAAASPSKTTSKSSSAQSAGAKKGRA
ncbi:MAG: DUF4339 domain-containing protein [Methylacidiphilales bacterium]|nr:DUF4339 domain-containing protein [Candidatus Methylacidiphilales bacterium]MDW8348921.1 hypothetical protein [Verrucomicrobiae bacterium]